MKKSRAYVLLAALVVFICICTASLTEGRLPLKREALTLQNDNLRAMRIELTAEEIAQYADECNLPVGEYLCTLMAAENWTADVQTAQSLTHKQAVALRNRLVRHYPEEFYKMSSLYAGLVADMQCFPIPVSKGNEQMWVEYCDSWGLERTYGGERRHEGTDIMAQNNTPGIYPVLSATAGTVTNIGWLELGGWRIGITSEMVFITIMPIWIHMRRCLSEIQLRQDSCWDLWAIPGTVRLRGQKESLTSTCILVSM